MARQQGVEIHLLQLAAAVFDMPARDHVQPGDQRFGFLAAVGFDDADHDVGAVARARLGGGEHFVGLADAGRGAEEDLQAATRFPLGFRQQRLGGRTAVAV